MLASLKQEVQHRQRFQFLTEIFEHSFQPFIAYYPDGSFMMCNSAFRRLTGFMEEELRNMSASIGLGFQLHHPDRSWLALTRATQEPLRIEAELQTRDGASIPVELLVHKVVDEGGAVLYYYAFVYDQSPRKQAEESLTKLKETLAKIFRVSPGLMFVCSLAERRCIDVNDRFLAAIGFHREEMVGHQLKDLDIWVDIAELEEALQEIAESKAFQERWLRYRSKSGEVRLALFGAELVDIDGQLCMLGILTDMTEKTRVERELARLNRLNTVGEIAASIGHEIRNPMTTVSGFLQMLREREEYFQEKGYFDIMIEELNRANAIIREFLLLAKDKPVKHEPGNLSSIVATLLPLLQAAATAQDKSLKAHLGKVPDIPLDEQEIRQVILNLCGNGLEAMEPGRTLVIRTYLQDGEVVLAVQDQGCGIPQEIIDKLGRPFVTTKEKGTGVGLSVCYSIAARHNAVIDVETGATGTTFYVRFARPVPPGQLLESSTASTR